MSQDAIAKLNGLIGALEAELAGDPRVKLLQDLKLARAAYVGTGGAEEEEATSSVRIAAPVAEGRQMTPARAKAFEISRDRLTGRREPLKTKILYAELERAGVDLPGGMNNLASLLGRFPKVFKSHGRQGWTLVTSPSAAGPETPEAADDQLFGSTSAASISSPPDQRSNLQ